MFITLFALLECPSRYPESLFIPSPLLSFTCTSSHFYLRKIPGFASFLSGGNFTTLLRSCVSNTYTAVDFLHLLYLVGRHSRPSLIWPQPTFPTMPYRSVLGLFNDNPVALLLLPHKPCPIPRRCFCLYILPGFFFPPFPSHPCTASPIDIQRELSHPGHYDPFLFSAI